jgi:rare lipoprotein A
MTSETNRLHLPTAVLLAALLGSALVPATALAATAIASTYGSPGDCGTTIAAPRAGRLTQKRRIIAHKTLPFGTLVRITYRGHSVVGCILDRGPFCGNRAFDLTPAVYRRIGFGKVGVGRISYKVVGRLPRSKWRAWR